MKWLQTLGAKQDLIFLLKRLWFVDPALTCHSKPDEYNYQVGEISTSFFYCERDKERVCFSVFHTDRAHAVLSPVSAAGFTFLCSRGLWGPTLIPGHGRLVSVLGAVFTPGSEVEADAPSLRPDQAVQDGWRSLGSSEESQPCWGESPLLVTEQADLRESTCLHGAQCCRLLQMSVCGFKYQGVSHD